MTPRHHPFDEIVGQSPAITGVRALLMRIAASRASVVLLTGEAGTGKDLAAKALHSHGGRATQSLLTITCSGVPEQLLESALFGHERGAFADAKRQMRGIFEIADGGTVYLDEIGDLTHGLQAKLLRVLEEKALTRVGGVQDRPVNVLVIASTRRDLSRAVHDGTFREDLFYRLKVIPVHLPPLRDRREDIAPLSQYFVDQYNREFQKSVRGVPVETLQLLEGGAWPGNVRELRNAIERAMLLTDREWLYPDDFTALSETAEPPALFTLPAEGVSLEEVERQLLVQALKRAAGNQTHAGQLLGINRDQVRYRIGKFGLRQPGQAPMTSASGSVCQ